MDHGMYRAVRDDRTTGRNEIYYNGRRIPHIPYHWTSVDDFTWGYRGAGPTNTARSILEHAIRISDEPIDIRPTEHMMAFRDEFITPHPGNEDGWTIRHFDVIEFLRDRSSSPDDQYSE